MTVHSEIYSYKKDNYVSNNTSGFSNFNVI